MSEQQQQAQEQPLATPAESPSQAAETTPESATGTTDVESGGKPNENDGEEKRGRNWGARKIDKLTREAREAAEQAAYYRGILESQQHARQQAPQPKDGPPQRSDFNDFEEFLRAEARYEARQEAQQAQERMFRHLAERQQHETLQRQAQEMTASFTKRLAETAKAIPDFEEVVLGEGADIPVGNAAPAIAEAENPAAVMHYLAKNPDVAYRIAALPPLRAAIEIGRIDASLKGKPQVSNAPPPGKPVGARGSTMKDLASMDYNDFVNARRKQIAARR